LSRRQGGLEEQVLEVMERREAVQARAEEMRVALQRLGTEEQAISGRRDEALAEISGEQERLRGERVSTAGELPADLLSLYEKVRADKGGVGAAALLRGRCEGCHLTLSGSDLAAIRSAPPDAVLRCEECRRILVRTPESGL
jgi:predicted  nucleic acid-binding Zn-ribbon protein